MEYISIASVSVKWGIVKRLQVLYPQNRINGVMHFEKSWIIPASTHKPFDARIKSRKYIKTYVAEEM